jgi:hypothetical protein
VVGGSRRGRGIAIAALGTVALLIAALVAVVLLVAAARLTAEARILLIALGAAAEAAVLRVGGLGGFRLLRGGIAVLRQICAAVAAERGVIL